MKTVPSHEPSTYQPFSWRLSKPVLHFFFLSTNWQQLETSVVIVAVDTWYYGPVSEYALH